MKKKIHVSGTCACSKIKKSEELAKKEKRWLDAVMGAIGDGISIQDTKFRVIYQNSAHVRLMGNHKGEFCYRAFSHRSRVCDGCPVARSFKDGKVHTVERSIAGKNGIRYFEITSSLLKDASGKIVSGIESTREITGRKIAEKKILESEEKYRVLVETSMDIIWMLDTEGNYTYFNKRAEELAGYSLKGMIGKPFKQFLEKSELPKVIDAFRKTLEGKSQKYEVFTKGMNGSRFLLSVNTAPIYSGGKITGTVSFAEDITLQRKSEDELKSTKQMLENIAEGITDSVFLLSLDYTILWANAAASRITGRKMENLIGNYCYAVTHNRTSPCVPPDDVCPMGDVMKTGKSTTVIHRHYKEGGEMRFVEVVVYPVKDETGKITQFVHTTRDITERQKMHDELIKLKLGLERSGDAIFITDGNGTITYINPSFENIYGYTKDEAIGKTPRIIKSGLIPENQYKQFWNTLLAKRIVSGEIINKRKDGTLVVVEGSNNPIIDGSGKITGFLAIHHDITNRKKAEEEKNKLDMELHKKVDELEKFNQLAVGRELKMIELKKRINELEGKSGEQK